MGKRSWQTDTPPRGGPEIQQRITLGLNEEHNSQRPDEKMRSGAEYKPREVMETGKLNLSGKNLLGKLKYK